ncbi:amino acid ABC transporter permease [Butyrivibrio sp.]|uniref:amino acid ABC transporter permease n=1 Tax=Butyrivibrio sp. TaxID=28121 RepID=UPI0025C08B27|nr:amino acid ABC transporter permease [Butyrivibrio sp.]MBQ9302455.1 amino acid ABC transporter permease [Butyrivibrio sp.]
MSSYTSRLSVKDALFEEPGPRAKVRIRIATVISLILLAALLVLVIRQFYITGQLESRYWSFFLKYTTWRFLGMGLLGTVEAASLGGILALLAGFVLMLGRLSKYKVFNAISVAIIEFTRGVPTLLFIYFFFLVVPQFGINMTALWKVVIPVALSACGIVAEVLRSGVNAVPKGQREAAISLGLSEGSTFIKVILPQAIRYVIPALISELVIVVKDTTFAYVVSFPDLMQNAKVLISNYDALLPVYLVVAVIYIIINYLLNKLSLFIAAKMNVKTVNVAEV